jgi:serpin B
MVNHNSIPLLITTSLLMMVFSCGGGGGGSDNFSVVASNLHRNNNPSISQTDKSDLVAGNSKFAFDLYGAVKAESGNVFYSPYSISLALAMTYAGARTNTETQMAKTMNFTLPQAELHPAFNSLDLDLATRGQGAKGKDGKGFRLKVANSLWGQKDYVFLQDFLDTLATNYGAGLRLVDFIGATEQSRLAINGWVETQTENRIKNLIPAGVLDQTTRLVLVNAIYFNAAWAEQFEKTATHDGTFNLLQGSPLTVPMMEQTDQHNYAEGDGWQAAELLYDKNEMSMLILLPASGHFQDFESTLSAGQVDDIVAMLQGSEVHITMPKFQVETELFLSDTLRKMGMPDAFSGGIADLSGMDGTRNLYISEVIHKAFVDVDEEGTEAAAATAVIVGETSAPDMSHVKEFKVDRPFIFLIRDNKTGTILFAGRIINPVGGV